MFRGPRIFHTFLLPLLLAAAGRSNAQSFSFDTEPTPLPEASTESPSGSSSGTSTGGTGGTSTGSNTNGSPTGETGSEASDTPRKPPAKKTTTIAPPAKRKKSSSSSAGPSIMAKGAVKGIVDGKLRFDSSMFKDISVGQAFIVESKTSGEIAAQLEVNQVSKNKRLTSAKIVKLQPGFQIGDLLGLRVYRDRDFKALYSETQLIALIAPDSIAGRNNMFSFHLNLVGVTPPAPNMITGVALNQSVTALGPTLEFYIPDRKASSLRNKFGVQVQYLQSVPISIVGRVGGSEETQTLRLSTTDAKAALVFKSRASKDSLSQFWVSVGYQVLDSKVKLDTNVGSGNTEVTFTQKGPELGFGGDFSPLPFLYAGAELHAGIAQKYNGTDAANSSSRSGSWNQVRTGVYGELRYPVGRAKSNVLTLQMKGGAAIDQIEIKQSTGSKKDHLLNPLFAVRLGLHSG